MSRMASSPPELVIFDLDGTLTDSAAGVLDSFRHALRSVGADVPTGDLVSLVVGPPMSHTMNQLGLGDRATEAVATYRADYTTRGWAMNTLFEGVTELLRDLRLTGVRLAIATSKAEPTARRILEHHGIAHHFDVIAGASVDGQRSAKVDVLARALEQLAPVPNSVVMVGDRAHDVEGAAAHGIATIVVRWGYGQSDFDHTSAEGPAAFVGTIDELREALGCLSR